MQMQISGTEIFAFFAVFPAVPAAMPSCIMVKKQYIYRSSVSRSGESCENQELSRNCECTWMHESDPARLKNRHSLAECARDTERGEHEKMSVHRGTRFLRLLPHPGRTVGRGEGAPAMITIKEIARLAGVSAKTAERALSGATKDIRCDARERAERVRKIAETYGYRPSELALSLRRGRVQSIGFMVDILTDQFLSAATEIIMAEAAKQDYRVALQVVRFDRGQTLESLKLLLASGMEGIITSCSPGQFPPQLLYTLERQKFPFFTLCGRSSYDFSSAAPNYSQALPQAVKSLAGKGHRKITLCLFAGKDADNLRNGNLFMECCRKYGVDGDFRVHHDLHQAASLAEQRLPAVILYGKYSMRVYQDRCAELDFHPDVVGVYNEWTLTAAREFRFHGIILEQAEEMVCAAVRQVFRQIEGDEIRHLSFPARFVKADELETLKRNISDLTNQRLIDRL